MQMYSGNKGLAVVVKVEGWEARSLAQAPSLAHVPPPLPQLIEQLCY